MAEDSIQPQAEESKPDAGRGGTRSSVLCAQFSVRSLPDATPGLAQAGLLVCQSVRPLGGKNRQAWLDSSFIILHSPFGLPPPPVNSQLSTRNSRFRFQPSGQLPILHSQVAIPRSTPPRPSGTRVVISLSMKPAEPPRADRHRATGTRAHAATIFRNRIPTQAFGLPQTG